MLWGCETRGKCIYDHSKKPIKIVGVMCSKRKSTECAREDPISNELLKIALKEAEKAGAETEILDLRDLQINPCKDCYSTCPAQCRFDEKTFQCDCYMFKHDTLFVDEKTFFPIEEAYDKMNKEKFFELYHDNGSLARKDEMYKVYKAFMEADGIIFSTNTIFYGRPQLLQNMFSRLCALDGGVEELWGDGKNLGNSVLYAKKKNSTYTQRLFGRHVAFINVSKEGDNVTPNLMKACTMMGMKIMPESVAYSVIWYDDPSYRSDKKKALNDHYTLALTKQIGKQIVEEIKNSDRKYGKKSYVV